MANKKSASAGKKSSAKPAAETTTKVTTVKAVEAGGSRRPLFSSARPLVNRGHGLLYMPITGAALAEFVGTFLLAVTMLIVRNEPFYLFLSLVGIFMMVGALSGAHINPAITVGAWVTRRIGWVRAVAYIGAQLLAAMLALVVMNSFIGQAPAVSEQAAAFGQSTPQLFNAADLPQGKEWTVLFAELIGVAVLGFAYASVLRGASAVRDKVTGAFTVGGAGFLAMAFASTVAGYVTATAVLNPAVALSLKALDFSNMWSVAIYAITALVGSVIGFFLYDLLRGAEE